jgi:hypothetical protein
MSFNNLVLLVFYLIMAGLVLRYWKGANSLLHTGLTDANSIIKTLEQ